VRTAYFIALTSSLILTCAGAMAQARYTCADSNGNTYQSNQTCSGREVVQRYTCTGSNGRSYASSQPCPSNGMVYYGPASNSSSSYEPTIPKVDQAPATLKYLSPRCASLNDAIRTAPARGLKHDVIKQMRKEYDDECSESERQADAQLSKDRKDKTKQISDATQAERADKERAALREQQCGESKRILFAKRARTDLTEGEKADLRRFEDNYRSRCG